MGELCCKNPELPSGLPSHCVTEKAASLHGFLLHCSQVSYLNLRHPAERSQAEDISAEPTEDNEEMVCQLHLCVSIFFMIGNLLHLAK